MVDLKDLLAPDGVTDPRYLAARNRFWEYCRLRDPRFFVNPENIYGTWRIPCKPCVKAGL